MRMERLGGRSLLPALAARCPTRRDRCLLLTHRAMVDADELTREWTHDAARVVGAVRVDVRALVAADDLTCKGAGDLAGAFSAVACRTGDAEGSRRRQGEAAEAEE